MPAYVCACVSVCTCMYMYMYMHVMYMYIQTSLMAPPLCICRMYSVALLRMCARDTCMCVRVCVCVCVVRKG